ncbi:MAG: hypothetical protein KatS3mg022_3195 [Armatimonadota bacterium]|nr:MAG: hypothetical protein KatS3mg022_3195 [Armatimonadota bacterium]
MNAIQQTGTVHLLLADGRAGAGQAVLIDKPQRDFV